jgi:acetoin utilization protein AcuB
MEIGSKLPWRVAVLLAIGTSFVFPVIAGRTLPLATGTTLGFAFGEGDVERRPMSALMTVQQIMATRIVTVELDDKLRTVREIFQAMKFHHLLVVDGGKLCGVISDRDLLRAVSPFIGTLSETERDVGTLDRRVHQIMSRKPITLRPTAAIADAITLFLTHNISCLPIVDEQFRPIGLVSWRDVLKSVVTT